MWDLLETHFPLVFQLLTRSEWVSILRQLNRGINHQIPAGQLCVTTVRHATKHNSVSHKTERSKLIRSLWWTRTELDMVFLVLGHPHVAKRNSYMVYHRRSTTDLKQSRLHFRWWKEKYFFLHLGTWAVFTPSHFPLECYCPNTW